MLRLGTSLYIALSPSALPGLTHNWAPASAGATDRGLLRSSRFSYTGQIGYHVAHD
jgi:hypothetical protein